MKSVIATTITMMTNDDDNNDSNSAVENHNQLGLNENQAA